MLVLQIIGGIALTIILLLIVFYVYVKIKFGKFLSDDTNIEPLSIHLNEDISPTWLNNKHAKTLTDELEKIGYQAGKTYSIFEMDGVYLQVFFKESLTAVVYSHRIAGNWVDIVINEEDKTEHTFSNASMGGNIEQRPEKNSIFLADATVLELHNSAEKILKNTNINFFEINESNFREYFESIYKKDIAWRNRKGGMNFDEFTKTAFETSPSISTKNLKEAFTQYKLNELSQWHTAALADYQKSNNIKEEDFYELEYKLLIVPFSSNAQAFLEYLENNCFIKESQKEQLAKLYLKETDMQKLFESINNQLSPELRADLISNNTFPLPLNIYRISEEMLLRSY